MTCTQEAHYVRSHRWEERVSSAKQAFPVLPGLGTELQEFKTFKFEPGPLGCCEHVFAKGRGGRFRVIFFNSVLI